MIRTSPIPKRNRKAASSFQYLCRTSPGISIKPMAVKTSKIRNLLNDETPLKNNLSGSLLPWPDRPGDPANP